MSANSLQITSINRINTAGFSVVMLRWETKGEKEKSAKTGRKHPLALFPRQIRKRYEKPFVDKWEHESPFRIVSITNSNEAFTSHMTIRMEMEARYGILQLLTKR